MKHFYTVLSLLILVQSIAAQQIISVMPNHCFDDSYFYMRIKGFNTHFYNCDSNEVFLVKGQDSVRFSAGSWQNDELQISGVANFGARGFYDLVVKNNVDGVMKVVNGFYVEDSTYVDVRKTFPAFVDKDQVTNVKVRAYSATFLSGGATSAFFFNAHDTIYPTSFANLTDTTFEVLLNTNGVYGGFYNLITYNQSQGYHFEENALYVNKPAIRGINSIDPDSFIYYSFSNPTLVSAYNTHFGTDTVISFVIDQSFMMIDASVNQIFNDSSLELYVNIPMVCKQPIVDPDMALGIFTPSDGLLMVPIYIYITGSINDYEGGFSNVLAYPNPVSDFLVLESQDFINHDFVRVNISSVEGKSVFNAIYNHEPVIKIYCGDLPSGIYSINLSSKTKRQSIKFIK